MRNGTPKRPTRSCRKNTGPRESSLIHSATSSSSGASSSRPSAASSTSKHRLAMPRAPARHASAVRTAPMTRCTSASVMRVYSGRLSIVS